MYCTTSSLLLLLLQTPTLQPAMCPGASFHDTCPCPRLFAALSGVLGRTNAAHIEIITWVASCSASPAAHPPAPCDWRCAFQGSSIFPLQSPFTVQPPLTGP
jgi:hypothetical protein